MTDRESSEAVKSALEVIQSEQSREFQVRITKQTLYQVAPWFLALNIERRPIFTNQALEGFFPEQAYQEQVGAVLLKKILEALKENPEGVGKVTIPLRYREVKALALASLDREFEFDRGLYGSRFWQTLGDGRLDHTRMVRSGKELYPSVYECVAAFVEAGGQDPYNLQGVFQRLSKLGDLREEAVG